MTATRAALTSSWSILAICLAVCAALAAISMQGSTAAPPLDANSAQPNGALALRLWLERLGYDVSVATQPDTNRLAAGTLVLIREGADVPSQSLPSLIRWLQHGGKLLVATDGSTGSTLLSRFGVNVAPVSESSVALGQPLLLAPPVARLDGDASAVIQGSEADVVVARGDYGPALTRRQVGRGILWVLSAPQLLQNNKIARGDNRRLLLDLAGPRATVVIDQQVLIASVASGGDWITTTVWGVAVLFLLGVAVFYRWLSGWRLGPPVQSVELGGRPAAEYVVALAGLLRRAGSRQHVLAVYQQQLQRTVAELHGGESEWQENESMRRVQELLLSPNGLSERALIDRVRAILEMEERIRTGHG